MALASSSMKTSSVMSAVALQCSWSPSSRHECFSRGIADQFLSLRRRRRCATSTLALSGRRHQNLAIASSSSNKKTKKSVPFKNGSEMDEDAFEALFSTLEEGIKNGDSLFSDDGGDNMSDGDLDKLQRELQEVLGVGDDDDDVGMIYSESDGIVEDDNAAREDDEKEEEEGEERPMKLKTWQLRRLASALKTGRRKISIKSLAAEVCLDRAVVLQLLRDPPPNLVLMSAALTDKPALQSVPESKPVETVPAEATTADAFKSEREVKVPVHVMRNRWSAQRRLKIGQVYTLERVYSKTRRPTNTMIDSIVHVTNLPRKRVVQWFEDKRNEDVVKHNRRHPYQRDANSESSILLRVGDEAAHMTNARDEEGETLKKEENVVTVFPKGKILAPTEEEVCSNSKL